VSFNNHREAKFLRFNGYNKDEAMVFIKHFDSPIRRALLAALVGDIDCWMESNNLTDMITSYGDSGKDHQHRPSVETTGLAELVCVYKTTETQAKPIEGGLINVNQRFILK
jgi:hypothetical protein